MRVGFNSRRVCLSNNKFQCKERRVCRQLHEGGLYTRALLKLIKDDEASGRKIGKEGVRTRYRRIRRTILRGRTGRRGDSIRTNTLLYQELEVLANYVVYRMYEVKKENTAHASGMGKQILVPSLIVLSTRQRENEYRTT